MRLIELIEYGKDNCGVHVRIIQVMKISAGKIKIENK